MGFMNVVWTVVFAGSAAYIARKDLGKMFRVLKRPTENFLKDVKAELDTPAVKPPTLPGSEASAAAAPPSVKAQEPPTK